MTTFTNNEQKEIEQANASGKQPVVFVHGLWLLSSSWDPWRAYFEEKGYATLAPGWPDDPETTEEAHKDPEVFAHKRIKQVTDYYVGAIQELKMKPVVIGHSFGGLIAQKIAGEGVAAVTVAIDPAPFRGVLSLPLSALKAGSPILSNPLNYGRAVGLTYDQFRFSFANEVDENEAHALYEKYSVPTSGVPLFQAATANLNPWTEASVDTKNPERGPLLVISGEKDNTVPHVLSHEAFQQQQKNPGVTEFQEIAGRGHALVIDHGWKQVADVALAFIMQNLPKS